MDITDSMLDDPKETFGEYCNFVDFSRIPTKTVKKSWVPTWLWNLVSEIVLDTENATNV